MDSQEYFNVFAKRLYGPLRGLDLAKSSKNSQLAALNFRQVFKGHMMCGLIKWRMGEAPVIHFEEAVRSMCDALATFKAWGGAFDHKGALPLARAAIVARLLGLPFDLPSVEEKILPPDVCLDYLLANAEPSYNAKDLPLALINELKCAKDSGLAVQTYENYFDILSSQDSAERLSYLVQKGVSLYDQRARDAFYSGGEQTEGGGPDNTFVVDYRLALVLKKVRGSSDVLHAWKW
ncbi:hypothetical protein [Herbaspirillum seropedicae]|uniref:hypothetical protein n=1 Tax=Herbaspirillum seropedicae TaxID=964 RepID=UPI003D984302